ncbi:MAG: 50S ribosomal protein L24 [Candidatus Doudnabacteria bacterium RIFCSPHIGHO2_01_FULL_49_9]|uniref:Large ribosomal subunit protein uL24 n=1 Tax=Candidatus Doudnabacteria bacterium RIFCSPHIGHO2_01_FULL_49_9 TaxID=1817827 RepID=A0A1F5NZ40_9BACT|nr:ribosomal protein L24 [uncultured bacterium]OGE82590.1 MAG: 50S ribosomal protein L24 [Candidatus Doudnabacteria bacterium RIFCSPHIGHO2_01_FULL_49_9]
MIIKKGQTVKILSGKDRNKTGKVLSVNAKTGKAVVEGVNILTRHERAKKAGAKGQKVQYPSPMNLSKLQLLCPHCGKPTRLGRKCTQCGKELK